MTVLTAAAAVVVASGVAFAALDGRHSHDDHAHLDTADGLLVSDRSELRMCIAASLAESGAGQQEAVQAHLLAALDHARRHPAWRSAYGDARYARSTALTWGCPAPKLPHRYEPKATVAGPGQTEHPSPYRVWIYVLDEPTADRVLGAEETTGIAAAELMRESNVLFPVSSALLIRQSRLGDPAAVAVDLQVALGLDTYRTEEDDAQ